MRYDLEECKNNDALEKMRGFYTKSVLKMNRNLRKPLSGTQIRKKISEEAELTEREKEHEEHVSSVKAGRQEIEK